KLMRDFGIQALLVQKIGDHIGDNAIDLLLIVNEMRCLIGERGDQLSERAVFSIHAGIDGIFHGGLPGIFPLLYAAIPVGANPVKPGLLGRKNLRNVKQWSGWKRVILRLCRPFGAAPAAASALSAPRLSH